MLKIYLVLWMLFALAAGTVGITGNFNWLAGVVFGFASMPLIFMGIIIVMPFELLHTRDKDIEVEKAPLKTKLTNLAGLTKGSLPVTADRARAH